ncbi:MAG: DUF262 domain-containing protein, partial [Mycoplasma sp.]
MDISKKTVREFLQNNNKLMIPFYQRDYTWSSKEVINLLEDVFNSKTSNYYIGSIILKNRGAFKSVIDGQQRISSLWIILKVISENKEELDEREQQSIEYLMTYFEFNSSSLKDGEILCKIIEGDLTSNSETIKKTNYYQNYLSIQKWMSKIKPSLKLFWTNFNKIIISEVCVDHDVDEHMLFAQINSTGKKLTAYDLAKNYLFSKLSESFEKKLENTNDIEKLINKKLEMLYSVTSYMNDDKMYNELIRYFISHHNGTLINNDETKLYEAF